MDKGRRAAALLIQKMPHIIPHSERVVLFRRYISSDKSTVGVFQDQASGRSTLVTIHRWGNLNLSPQIRKNIMNSLFYIGKELLKMDTDNYQYWVPEIWKVSFELNLSIYKDWTKLVLIKMESLKSSLKKQSKKSLTQIWIYFVPPVMNDYILLQLHI